MRRPGGQQASIPREGAIERARQLGIVAIIFLVTLAIADVIGVAINFVLDVLQSRRDSGLLRYTVWLVLGVLLGVVNGAAGEKDEVINPWIKLGVIVGLLAAVVGLCARFEWPFVTADDPYVPDSMSHSITFFVAIVAGAMLSVFAGGAPAQRTRGGGKHSAP
jgi:hypothetical protein